MVKTDKDIYNELARIERTDTGNVIETITTYRVKSKTVDLIIEKTPSGENVRYKIRMSDAETGDYAETDILFTVYPSKCVDHSTIIGNNNNRIYHGNSGIIKNVHNICKAIAKYYNVGVCKIHC